MKATASLSVILAAVILALGDGAYLLTDNRETEMDAIQRALNQAATPSNEYLEELKDQPTRTPQKNDMLSDIAAIQRALNQAATPSNEYMEELKDQPTRTPGPDKNELAYMLMLNALTQQGSTTSDNISQGDEVAFQTYLRNKYIGCASTYCTPTTGPGLYMNYYDWLTNAVSGFQIYRMNGKGNVRVGEVVAIYYPKEKKWMKSHSSYYTKDTCPGKPSQENGMEDDEKWLGCSESVFKIYAMGKSVGDDIRRGDDISLYLIKEKKWLSAETSYIQKNTCSGTSRPPSSHTYDTCYKEVFELFKR